MLWHAHLHITAYTHKTVLCVLNTTGGKDAFRGDVYILRGSETTDIGIHEFNQCMYTKHVKHFLHINYTSNFLEGKVQ